MVVICCFVGASAAVTPQTPTESSRQNENPLEALLKDAIDAYQAGQSLTTRTARLAAFSRARQLFSAAIAQGADSADVYTNLGIAALQGEELGQAVLAFRRALLREPDHTTAKTNLLQARALLPAWVPTPKGHESASFFFWRDQLAETTVRTFAAAAFFVAACAGAIAIYLTPGSNRSPGRSPVRSGALGIALVSTLVWAALAVSTIVTPSQSNDIAVLLTDETAAFAADSEHAPTRFSAPLPGGTEVQVRQLRERWMRIELANGQDAWIRRSSAGFVANDVTATTSP